ncbi:hypothetical protein CRUP_018219 [Coryphaenoides rupestris]|nr:hypothetical protein CRUP_018219 [Coryphaenoides rupestris]
MQKENALHRLKKQQEELEAMRLRYLATEEKEAEESLGPTPSEGAGPEHLSRLLEERDSLLRTGVYTHNDLIISQLNTQIQQAMTTRGQH